MSFIFASNVNLGGFAKRSLLALNLGFECTNVLFVNLPPKPEPKLVKKHSGQLQRIKGA